MFCPECGTENKDGSKFCKKCGTPLTQNTIKESYNQQETIPKVNQSKSKFAENKVLIIAIIAIVIVAACAAGFILLQPHYKEINVIGVSMEVPDSDYNVSIDSQFTNTYFDDENHVAVYGFDSTNAGLFDLIGEGAVYAGVRDAFINNSQSQSITQDSITFYDCGNGTYGYTTYFGHKNIFIVTQDKNTLIHIIKSLKVNDTTDATPETTSDLKVISGDITTGSSLSDKTKAHIYVGSEHSGETIKITAVYMRDGANLNNGNILSKVVDSDGYVSFNSAEPFNEYPDTAIIKIYDNDGNIIDSKTVNLDPQSGTQSF